MPLGKGRGNQCHYITSKVPKTIYETQYQQKCQNVYEDQCHTGKEFLKSWICLLETNLSLEVA